MDRNDMYTPLIDNHTQRYNIHRRDVLIELTLPTNKVMKIYIHILFVAYRNLRKGFKSPCRR